MYYKCTFHDDRGCKAKKIAQRSNGNPSVIQVRYSEVHSCQRDAQFFKNQFPISEIEADDGGKSPSNWSFTANDGGKSPSYLPYVDSSAQRAMAFTGHSADQMHRFQGSEKEVSADFIPSPQQNEGPSNCQASLPPCGLSSASGANYMPPTNPRMQTRGFLLEFAELFGTDLSSASDANDWASFYRSLMGMELGMPPTNPLLQTMDTCELGSQALESDIAVVVSPALIGESPSEVFHYMH